MSFNLEWIWWIAQIFIDIILLAALFIMAGRLKKQKSLGQAPMAAEDFVEQAGNLAREFDRLLGEKRELVGTTLATLDARIDELRAMLEQTRALKEKIATPQPVAGPVQPPAKEPAAIARNSYVEVMEDDDPFELPPGHPLSQIKEKESVPLSEEQEFRSQVLHMLGQGRSPQEIANATGRPRAEVELLIALIK